MGQTFVLEDVVASAMDVALQGVWTSLPGIVDSYDAAFSRANIRVAIKSQSIAEDGDSQVEEVAVLTAVPVMQPGGSGFRSYCPLQQGDTVMLMMSSRSMDQFLAKGGIVDPTFTHHHHISDAVAFSGLRDFAHPLKSAPKDHASIGYDEGASIEFRPSEIRLGGESATEPTFKANTYMTAFDILIAAISSAVGAVPGASTAITAAKSVFDTSVVAAFTSTVKVL